MGHREEGCNYRKPGPEKGHAYGAAAIGQAIAGADFPMSKQELIQRYGNKQVELTKGSPMRLRDVLEKTNVNTFNSAADVEHAFHEEY